MRRLMLGVVKGGHFGLKRRREKRSSAHPLIIGRKEGRGLKTYSVREETPR